MKNKFLIITSTIIVILLAIILIFSEIPDNYYKELTFNEFKEKIDNNESFPLLIKQESCSHCKSFEPKFKNVAVGYEVESYYINTTNLNDDDKNSLSEIIEYEGTPTVFFIKNGSVMKNTIEGDRDKKIIINQFKRSGFIED